MVLAAACSGLAMIPCEPGLRWDSRDSTFLAPFSGPARARQGALLRTCRANPGARCRLHVAAAFTPAPAPQPSVGEPPSALQRLHSAIAPVLACAVVASQLLWTGPANVAMARHTPLTAEERGTITLFKESTPAVVFITNLRSGQETFTLDQQDMPQGAGSGVIWDDTGVIVTNLHVVKGASEVQVNLVAPVPAGIQVSLTGGFVKGGSDSDFKAKVLGFDEDKDIAVLKIDVPDKEILHPLKLGDSSDLLVGQRVFAIGNPFGLDHTLTTGVISGTGREIVSGINGRPIQGVIQIDAAINPGNSGGPLLDSAGELIGINTAIYSPSGANAGVGFAVPVDILKSSVSQILQYGKVIRPILGIAFAPEQSVEQLGVQGILVLDTRKGGPAAKAGIQGTSRDGNGRLILGDIIVKFNNQAVRSSSDLYKGLDKCAVGDVVSLEVLRQDSRAVVPIVLEPSS